MVLALIKGIITAICYLFVGLCFYHASLRTNKCTCPLVGICSDQRDGECDQDIPAIVLAVAWPLRLLGTIWDSLLKYSKILVDKILDSIDI